MLFERLSAMLKLLTCGTFLTIWATSSSAGVILDPVTPEFSGTGLGNQLTILTLQGNRRTPDRICIRLRHLGWLGG
jgi:hypothetical protein